MTIHVDNTLEKEEAVDTPEKNIDYFMQNPDEMPTDEKSLEALMMDGVIEESVKKTPEPSDKDADKKAETDSQPAEGEEKQEEEKDEPILAADGKNVIPNSVLKNTRANLRDTSEKLKEAEELLEAERVKAKELAEKVDAFNAGGEQESDLTKDEEGKIDFDALREEFHPSIVDILEKQNKELIASKEKISELSTKAQKVEQSAQETKASSVQEAIDSVPFLADAQASNPALWSACVAADNQLRSDPKWSDKTADERFKEVARLLGGEQPKETTKSEKSAKQVVDEALEKAEAIPVNTLSDLPGGSPAIHSETEKIDAMSVTDLEKKFENMSKDQIEGILSNL